jgi:hypothetical protein
MKTATLEQFHKLVTVMFDKVSETPSDQVQAVLGSGALSDIFEANFSSFDRDAFRTFLGLKPLNPPAPPLLIPVGTTTVAATTTSFIARARFVLNTGKKASVKNSPLGYNFKRWFLGKEEQPFVGSTLKYGKLSRCSVDSPIIAELGGEEQAETTLTELFALMSAQKNGEKGALLTNGYANIFYIKDVNGVLRAVRAHWDGGGWDVDADDVTNSMGWDVVNQVFSRDSRLPLAV